MGVTPKFTHLILSGGGSKGFSYLGILRYLYNEKLANNINHIAGTSIGAMFGVIFALKIPIDFIEEAIYETLENFNEKESVFSNIDIFNFFNSNGFKSNDCLIQPIVKYLRYKYEVDDMTYIDFVKRTGVNLYINCTNLNTGNKKIFSLETTPNVSVLDSIKASTCIPFIYQPVCIDGEYFVDGIISKPFNLKNTFTDTPSENVLYFYLAGSKNEQLAEIPKGQQISLLAYCKRIVSIFILNLFGSSLEEIEEYSKCPNTVFIGDVPYECINIKTQNSKLMIEMTSDDINHMILLGYITMSNYINNRYKDKLLDIN